MTESVARPVTVVTRQATAGRDMTEAALQRHVIDQARSLGWGVTLSARKTMLEQAAGFGVEAPPLDGLIFHPRYSLGSEPGWPDLTLIRRRDRRLIFAELKAEKGRLSVRQAEVLELLRCLTDGPGWDALDLLATKTGDPSYPEWDEVARRTDEARNLLPRIEVFVWRPSDIDRITEVLR